MRNVLAKYLASRNSGVLYQMQDQGRRECPLVKGNLGNGREGKWGDLEEARKESVSDTIRMWEMFIDAKKY